MLNESTGLFVLSNEANVFCKCIMVIHNFRTADETRYMLLVMAEKRVGKPQKLKTDLGNTIQPLTLR